MPRDKFDVLLCFVKKFTSKYKAIIVSFGIAIGAFILWLAWGLTSDEWAIWAGALGPHAEIVPVNTTAAGAWGDSFGPFNAFFAAIGSGAVVITLHMQYKSLKEQRNDLHIQRFEQTFFELIKLMRELREQVVYSQTEYMDLHQFSKYHSPSSTKGYRAIKFAFYEVRQRIVDEGPGGDGNFSKKQVARQYDNCVHKRYESRFAPLFRIIYTILIKIKTDEILNEQQKAYYGNILRSQLTSYDVMLLAFNGMSEVSKDLEKLINYFRLLKYVPPGRGRKILIDVYEPIAFQSRDGD